MAQGYATDEALGFCTEYFDLYPHSTRRMWDLDEELSVSGELLLGAHRSVKLGRRELDQIHEHVISHNIHTSELLRYDAEILYHNVSCMH